MLNIEAFPFLQVAKAVNTCDVGGAITSLKAFQVKYKAGMTSNNRN